MSSFKGSHLVDHVFELRGAEELSLDRYTSFDHEEDGVPFRVVYRTY